MSALHICKVQGFIALAWPCQVRAHMWFSSSNFFLINFTWKNMCDRFCWWLKRMGLCSLLAKLVLKFCWKSPLFSFKKKKKCPLPPSPLYFTAHPNCVSCWSMYHCLCLYSKDTPHHALIKIIKLNNIIQSCSLIRACASTQNLGTHKSMKMQVSDVQTCKKQPVPDALFTSPKACCS